MNNKNQQFNENDDINNTKLNALNLHYKQHEKVNVLRSPGACEQFVILV